jgi:hypothetical protein
MGIGLVVTAVFFAVLAVIYGFMRLSCFLKKKYGEAENFLFIVMTFFMCDSCRKACESHTKLVIRAVAFAVLVTAISFGIAYFVR